MTSPGILSHWTIRRLNWELDYVQSHLGEAGVPLAAELLEELHTRALAEHTVRWGGPETFAAQLTELASGWARRAGLLRQQGRVHNEHGHHVQADRVWMEANHFDTCAGQLSAVLAGSPAGGE